LIPLIDRYILKKFLIILSYNLLAFIVIFIVIDLIENLDKFLSYQAALKNVFFYYIYYIPYIIILTLPISMLLSSLFTLGSMAQHNELVAIQTSGVSLYRIIFPLLLLALAISIISGFAGESLVPSSNRARLDILRFSIQKQSRNIRLSRNNLAIQDNQNRQIYIQFYETTKQKAHKVNIITSAQDKIVKRIDAQFMLWNTLNHYWILYNVSERILDQGQEILTHRDSLIFSDSNITPDDLLDLEILPEEMNYNELNRLVDKMLTLGADARKWLVDLYMKISYPFANFIIVVFGAPLAARKRRSGPALGFALALFISFIYFIFLRTGQVLGHKGDLDPWLAAWIGNIVFGIGAVFLLFKVKK
jgi:lipopolysaccharide export system permease protein